MSRLLRVAAISAVMALQAIGCFAPAAPTPVPTATPDIGAMVQAAIASALNGPATPIPTVSPTSRPTYTPFPTPNLRPTYTPVPTPTMRPTNTLARTPTPIPKRLAEVECNPPDCIRDYEPPWDYVEWRSGPRVSANGVISLVARIDERIKFVVKDREGRGNITLSDGSDELYGSIVPPSGPGWDWRPKPGLWIASEYRYSNRTFRVRAQIDPAAATHPGLELCLWSGGTRTEQQLLDCVPVQQP